MKIYVKGGNGLYYQRGGKFVEKPQATSFDNIVDADAARRNCYDVRLVNDNDQTVMGMRVGRGMPIATVVGGAA